MLDSDRITAKTAQRIITNICTRTAYNLIQQVRQALGKAPHQIITVGEFCAYWGLTPPHEP